MANDGEHPDVRGGGFRGSIGVLAKWSVGLWANVFAGARAIQSAGGADGGGDFGELSDVYRGKQVGNGRCSADGVYGGGFGLVAEYASGAKAMVLGGIAGGSVGAGDAYEGACDLDVHFGGFGGDTVAGTSAGSMVGTMAGFDKRRWGSEHMLVAWSAQECGDERGNSGAFGLAGWGGFDIEFAGGGDD